MKNKTDDELIDKVNGIISDLVYPKFELLKAYNYYMGKLDAELYRYLEENYGIGQPTAISFIPLIKKHVDALVGEYLGTPIIPRVSCKDSNTISNITREKLLAINEQLLVYLRTKLQHSIFQIIDKGNSSDPLVKDELDKVVEDLNESFISLYEIAALNVLSYIMLSRLTDIYTKLKTIFIDALITGYTYYRVKPSLGNNNVIIEPLSPLNTFNDKNPNSPYVKDSNRVVIRRWLSKELILTEYGKDLSKDDIERIKEIWDSGKFYAGTYYVRSLENSTGVPRSEGLRAGLELVPGYPTGPYNRYNNLLIPVYEVEWIETDSLYIMQRYLGVRIGEDIHIVKGIDDSVIRSQDNPGVCTLSVNGVYFTNRSAEPYSLVLACASLLDKYNLLYFYRDNLIANSGTTGDWIDLSMIPKLLGIKWPDRVKKWLAYKKGGIGIIDTSQEGRLSLGLAPINTIFNGFDDTVKAQAILAIQLAIDSIEQTVSSITGVFRERLNGILQKDAVTNVLVGLNNSFIITKLYYLLMDLVTTEMLVDCLNCGKIVFKNGLTGVLILGDKQLKIFTALPEHFTVSDYDVHILTSTDIIKETEQIKQILPELIKAGIDPSILIEAFTCKSLTELKSKVLTAIKKQKEEANQIGKLSLNLELAQLQIKELSEQLKLASSLVDSLNKANTLLELTKLQLENRLNWFNAQTDRLYKTSMADTLKLRTEIEKALLYDGNPYNDKIKQI